YKLYIVHTSNNSNTKKINYTIWPQITTSCCNIDSKIAKPNIKNSMRHPFPSKSELKMGNRSKSINWFDKAESSQIAITSEQDHRNQIRLRSKEARVLHECHLLQGQHLSSEVK
ncbi:hypothetical protein PanWU01x14_125700, partial [Parasponia andersonii]